MEKIYIEKKIPEIESNNYYIKSVEYGYEGLIIILTCEEQKNVQIKFDGFVESYRYGTESYRMYVIKKMIKDSDHTVSNKFHYFCLEKSEYLKWLNEESHTITNFLNAKHYVFIDNDCILDVVFTGEPEFETIENKLK